MNIRSMNLHDIFNKIAKITEELTMMKKKFILDVIELIKKALHAKSAQMDMKSMKMDYALMINIVKKKIVKEIV